MKILAALVLSLAVMAGLYQLYEWQVTKPHDGAGAVTINIPKGATGRHVAAILKSNDVIGSSFLFELEARIAGAASKLKLGEYRLKKNLSIKQVLTRLTMGRTVLYPVTIPEGLTIKEIGALLQKKEVVTEISFMAAATDPDLISRYKIPADSLEGYIFPETYNFPKDVAATQVVEVMLKTFFEAVSTLGGDIIADPDALLRLVTLASLIEKETAVDDERTLVASVYTNRLKRGMLLQCDPTVIYALPDFDGNIRKKDLSYDSPYNTYRYPGLPPGPIASPGLLSIGAALAPAQTKFLYFVAKEEKRHHFSATLTEHNRAVKKYQKGGRKK